MNRYTQWQVKDTFWSESYFWEFKLKTVSKSKKVITVVFIHNRCQYKILASNIIFHKKLKWKWIKGCKTSNNNYRVYAIWKCLTEKKNINSFLPYSATEKWK